MTTTVEGVFFVGSRGLEVARPEGIFRLLLNMIDSQDRFTKEPYECVWLGEDAESFYKADTYRPGDALHIVLENPRSFPSGRSTVIRGRVVVCERAPRAPARMRATRETTGQHA